LGAIFEARRELFGEFCGRPALAINTSDWEWRKHPVIRIDLAAGEFKFGIEHLMSSLRYEVTTQSDKHGVELRFSDITSQFKYLIKQAYKNYNEKAVVIIDEYDKPLLETMHNRELHIQIRDLFTGCYGVLKSSDQFLRFTFITGVTKFSQVSLFSDLNHLSDLTMQEKYADLVGWTDEELFREFEPFMEINIAKTEMSKEDYNATLRKYYNGYRFSEKDLKVYNPFGLLNHFDHHKFASFWDVATIPTFLIDLIREQKIDIVNIKKMEMTNEDLAKFEIDSMNAVAILYQSGYLTVDSYDKKNDVYSLDFPNEEVRTGFMKTLIAMYLQPEREKARTLIINLPKFLRNGDADAVMKLLQSFMKDVPGRLTSKLEHYYHTVVHIVFNMLGLSCRSEVETSDGRLDAIVETDQYVYCFEFKINKSAASALKQIEEKGYLLPYQGCGKRLFKVGVKFDTKKRTISEWVVGDSKK
jgi:hypothetical protein